MADRSKIVSGWTSCQMAFSCVVFFLIPMQYSDITSFSPHIRVPLPLHHCGCWAIPTNMTFTLFFQASHCPSNSLLQSISPPPALARSLDVTWQPAYEAECGQHYLKTPSVRGGWNAFIRISTYVRTRPVEKCFTDMINFCLQHSDFITVKKTAGSCCGNQVSTQQSAIIMNTAAVTTLRSAVLLQTGSRRHFVKAKLQRLETEAGNENLHQVHFQAIQLKYPISLMCGSKC